jgi:hypothetical protein
MRSPCKAEYSARTLRRVNVCNRRVPEMLEDREAGKTGGSEASGAGDER